MYGLEDEYIDSTLNVIPDHQFTEVNDPSYTTRKRGDGFCHCRTCDALGGRQTQHDL